MAAGIPLPGVVGLGRDGRARGPVAADVVRVEGDERVEEGIRDVPRARPGGEREGFPGLEDGFEFVGCVLGGGGGG